MANSLNNLNPWKWESEFGKAFVASKSHHEDKVRYIMADKGKLLLDTETSGLDSKRQLRLVQVGWGKQVFLLSPRTNNAFIREIMESDTVLICHNAAFDLVNLGCWRHGKEEGYQWAIDKVLKDQAVCTMVTEQIATASPRVKSLAALAAEEGVPNTYEDEFNDRADELGIPHDEKYAKIDINDPCYLRYSSHDIFQLNRVYKRIRDSADSELVTDESKCSVLYEILHDRGMGIDEQKAQELHQELGRDLQKYKNWLAKKDIELINSSAQVASALKSAKAKLKVKTPTGKTKVDKGVLESITKPKEAHVIAVRVLKARSLAKDQASIANLQSNTVDGRVYPTLWRIGAVTGRSSCDSPNLQQLNKHEGDKRVRGLLMADEGHRLGTVDYNGLELRVIADIAKDPALIEHLMNGADIHGEVARRVFGKKYTDKQRNYSKAAVFALLYGASNKSIAKQVKCDVEEATAIRDSFYSLYTKVQKYSSNITKEANETGYTTLPNGWTPAVGKAGGQVAGYKAVNYNIQGMAAFLVRRGAVQLAEAGLWQHVRMVVHDEFVLSLPEKKAQKILEDIAEAAVVKTKRMTYTTSMELFDRHWGLVA